ncbi:MAG TPA: hypothetical protein VJ833_08485 [Rhodanobacteraceae bacterium]|nr:hypothetical protein [Rhodanobacteraceae bacterium]
MPAIDILIAVVSFAGLSAKKDQALFSQGMAEEILNTLIHIKICAWWAVACCPDSKARASRLKRLARKAAWPTWQWAPQTQQVTAFRQPDEGCD